MTDSSQPDAAAATIAEIEAQITKRGRPVMSETERLREGFQNSITDCRLAAAKARQAASTQTQKAENFEAQIAKFESEMAALPEEEAAAGPEGNGTAPPEQEETR